MRWPAAKTVGLQLVQPCKYYSEVTVVWFCSIFSTAGWTCRISWSNCCLVCRDAVQIVTVTQRFVTLHTPI